MQPKGSRCRPTLGIWHTHHTHVIQARGPAGSRGGRTIDLHIAPAHAQDTHSVPETPGSHTQPAHLWIAESLSPQPASPPGVPVAPRRRRLVVPAVSPVARAVRLGSITIKAAAPAASRCRTYQCGICNHISRARLILPGGDCCDVREVRVEVIFFHSL